MKRKLPDITFLRGHINQGVIYVEPSSVENLHDSRNPNFGLPPVFIKQRTKWERKKKIRNEMSFEMK